MLIQDFLLLPQQALVRLLLLLLNFSFTRKFAKYCWLRGVLQKPEALKHKKEVAAVFVTPRGIFVRDVSAF